MNELQKLLCYKELLDILSKDSPNHLLLGNGFNNTFRICTSYKKIFAKMKEDYPQYKKFEDKLRSKKYDIELLIKDMRECLESNNILPDYPDYIENKIKIDFMKATAAIVTPQVKKIYPQNKDGIHLLFKEFTNYFTLNYDPLLYLLLMKFKKNPENKALSTQATLAHIEESKSDEEKELYNKIKEAHENGTTYVDYQNGLSEVPMKELTKSAFTQVVEPHMKKQYGKIKTKTVKETVDRVWQDKDKTPKVLNVIDAFKKGRQGELIYDDHDDEQNLFFLHGAFHIYRDGSIVKKIAQTQNKAFHKRLEDIVNSETRDVICILTGETDNKKEQIQKGGEYSYLAKCFNKLQTLEGNLVVLGSSLSENDEHIFNEIEKSNVSDIYIATEEDQQGDIEKKASKYFSKKLHYFDYTTISYANNQKSN